MEIFIINDTQVFDAHAYNHSTGQEEWVGIGTWDAIQKRGFRAELPTVCYCPKEWLVDGLRWKDMPPPRQ